MLRPFFDKVHRHRPIAAGFFLSLLLIGGGWLWVYLRLRDINQTLILHFNSHVGINQVGDLEDLVPVGVFSLLSVLLGFFIALELEERDWFLGKLLTVGALAFSALIFIGFAAILAVN